MWRPSIEKSKDILYSIKVNIGTNRLVAGVDFSNIFVRLPRGLLVSLALGEETSTKVRVCFKVCSVVC